VIVIGRTLPPPSAVECQAEALTGRPVARLPRGSWYPLVDATREIADGSLVAAETVRHPDAIAEAFRWRACERVAFLVRRAAAPQGGLPRTRTEIRSLRAKRSNPEAVRTKGWNAVARSHDV